MWPSMCDEYGVTADRGFDYSAFVAFKTDAEAMLRLKNSKHPPEPEPEPRAGTWQHVLSSK